jgi:hypothetical protein
MNSPIEEYLATLERWLGMNATTRAQILAEVRAHLEEAAARDEATGAAHAAAQTRAIDSFGAAKAVAERFNAVHPAEWDMLRFVKGVAWGVVASWFLWTLVTYPLLVWLTLQQGHIPGNPPGVFTDPTLELLFYATPLAFGAFWVLATSPLLWLVPFLLLYAAVPFAWGRHSRPGWRPGLAYGLGVVVGFPWMLPAVAAHWMQMGADAGGGALLITLAIWLLVPFAMLASWLGSRRRLWLPDLRRRRDRLSSLRIRSARRLPVVRIMTVGGALALLGLSVWAWTAAAAWGARPQPTAADQLAAARRVVEFPIRLPTALPDSMGLASAQLPVGGCASCSVSLVFQGLHGHQLILDESDANPSGGTIPSPPNYQVSEVGVTGEHPVWWLGESVTVEQQVNLEWTADGIFYFLGSNGTFSIDELKQIAASIPAGSPGA